MSRASVVVAGALLLPAASAAASAGAAVFASRPSEAAVARHAGAVSGCTVPALIGREFDTARTLLAGAHCKLGRVSRPRRDDGVLVVVAQNPGRGKQLPDGAGVALELGVRHGVRE